MKSAEIGKAGPKGVLESGIYHVIQLSLICTGRSYASLAYVCGMILDVVASFLRKVSIQTF